MIDPLVSVLLITYDNEPYIRKVLEGVLMQITRFPFELVIGEDCSNDTTRNICEEYFNKHPNIIRLLPAEENLGLNLNFIRTFKECKGKYIAYLEGDDWWITPDKLQKQVNILEKEADVSLVHTNCMGFDVENNIFKHRLIRYEGVCIREQQYGIESVIAEFEGCFRPMKTSTACYRRKLMEEILLQDEFLFANPEFPTQDFQLFQEMSLRGRFAFIDEETTVIGLHDSLSVPKELEKQIVFRFGFFKIGIYLIDKYKLPQKTVDIWMRRQLYYFLNYGIKHGNKSLVAKVVKEANKRNYRLPLLQFLKYITLQVIH